MLLSGEEEGVVPPVQMPGCEVWANYLDWTEQGVGILVTRYEITILE